MTAAARTLRDIVLADTDERALAALLDAPARRAFARFGNLAAGDIAGLARRWLDTSAVELAYEGWERGRAVDAACTATRVAPGGERTIILTNHTRTVTKVADVVVDSAAGAIVPIELVASVTVVFERARVHVTAGRVVRVEPGRAHARGSLSFRRAGGSTVESLVASALVAVDLPASVPLAPPTAAAA
jgi:hypothetical protein